MVALGGWLRRDITDVESAQSFGDGYTDASESYQSDGLTRELRAGHPISIEYHLRNVG